jgi:cell division protein FtsB
MHGLFYGKTRQEEFMFGRNHYLLILTCALTVMTFTGGAERAKGQDVDCSQLEAQIQQADQVYKEARHKQADAFGDWDKYYKSLHSDTYEGTDEPLADTAQKCESDDTKGNYCSGAMVDYENMTASEKKAKQKLDAANAEEAKAQANLDALKQKAQANGCDLGEEY